MQLAALTKRLKTRKSKREQDWNNKLHRHNQKAFYSMIRTRGEGIKQISDPPPEEEVKSFWETQSMQTTRKLEVPRTGPSQKLLA